jgi:hypothetical protein
MSVDIEKALKGLVLPTAGKKLKVRIAEMRPDVLSNIIPAEKMQKGSRPNTQVILLLDGDGERVGFLTLPRKGRVYKSSNMFKFITKYGGPPKVGMEVELEEDERGFRRLVM